MSMNTELILEACRKAAENDRHQDGWFSGFQVRNAADFSFPDDLAYPTLNDLVGQGLLIKATEAEKKAMSVDYGQLFRLPGVSNA